MKKEKGTEAKFLLPARWAPGNILDSGRWFNSNREVFLSLGKAQYHRGKRSEGGLIGHFNLLALFFFDYWNKVTTSQDARGMILGLEYINRADVTADTTYMKLHTRTYLLHWAGCFIFISSSRITPRRGNPAVTWKKPTICRALPCQQWMWELQPPALTKTYL